MILHLKCSISDEQASAIAEKVNAFLVKSQDTHVLITGSGVKEVPASIESFVDSHWVSITIFNWPQRSTEAINVRLKLET